MTHTPGPWRFRPEGTNGYTDCGAIVGPNGDDICDFGDSETYYPSNGSAPSDEDARLIVAAPDLLAAAKALRAAQVDYMAIRQTTQSSEERERYGALVALAASRLDTVIAKAEGR